MAELNLKQITDKLNAEFSGETRKLIFWYDANAEFVDDIDALELSGATVYHLKRDNQFYTKYFFERVDTKNSYLVYAPFPKPALCDNHLADTLLYSKEFFADRASLVAIDLGIDEKYKPVLQHYIKFFGAKERSSKFYELEVEIWNKKTIEKGMMSVLCKTKVVSFEEIVRTMITGTDLEDNKYLIEFEKYDLVASFFSMCEETFGYSDESPSLSKLLYTLFVTYMAKTMQTELPQSLKNYCSFKSGNIIAFVDSIMNSVIYKDNFDQLSELTYHTLNVAATLEKLDVDCFMALEIFKKVDEFIIKWLIERLENEDTDARLSGYTIPEICQMRKKMHYGELYFSHYTLIENAYFLILAAHFEPEKTIQGLWKSYVSTDYLVDKRYRTFYYHYDKIANNEMFNALRELVENIYTSEFLNPLSLAWSNAYADAKGDTGLIKQQDFFKSYVKNTKERTIVIISDALRFEVGKALMKSLMADEKCTATITPMQSVLPSTTRFGMSALLPHKTLGMNEDYRVMVDDKICDDLKNREKILKAYVPNSRTAQFDEIKTVKDAKALTLGQDLVYIYHNQIDARGDKLNTENEVFTACEEAVAEIHGMIKRLTSANNIHFIITADHGFIYKRDKLRESDKISGLPQKNAFVSRRTVVNKTGISADGIGTVTLGDILGSHDERIVSFPIGSDIFKIPGGGLNYVHGGASLQEMLIPVIDVRTNKYHTETRTVSISLVSLVHKITNLTTNLDFIQNDAVTDLNKETVYKLYFIAGDTEKISGENIYVADKKDRDPSKRVFRLKFNFKNKQYDKNKKYYLVAYDEKHALEVIRHEVQMDLAFADDFGFNV
ncbi:MAG: BREX-1 system phosphatase PglZ type A [Eubacteriaceae bacterium]